jgi:transcriptional regulator NrdR family protein
MVCVYCGAPTRVTNTRPQRRTNDIWRRRHCVMCAGTFTSHETADLSSALRVTFTKNDLRPFHRDILFISLYESCKHRPTAIRDSEGITRQVIIRLLTTRETPGLVTRRQIIQTCLAVLEPFDTAAATVYRIYHPL